MSHLWGHNLLYLITVYMGYDNQGNFYFYYASVGGAPEAYGSRHVCVCVCVCVSVCVCHSVR